MRRNATLDIARLVAAFGIVFFHVGAPGSGVGYAALPFFIILLVAMAIPTAKKLDLTSYTQGRAVRLLLPWLLWSGLYAGLKLAELAVTGASFGSEFAPSMLLTGPALHLWFLPFAFVACLLAYPAARLAHHTSVAILLAIVGVLALGLSQTRGLPVPLAQWVYAGPAVFLGLALAMAGGRLWQMGLILFGFCGVALAAGWTSGLGQLALAGAAYILCLALPHSETPLSRRAGAAAMGVYLAHPLVLSVLVRTTSIPENSLGMALLVCLGALILSATIEALIASLQRPKRKLYTILQS